MGVIPEALRAGIGDWSSGSVKHMVWRDSPDLFVYVAQKEAILLAFNRSQMYEMKTWLYNLSQWAMMMRSDLQDQLSASESGVINDRRSCMYIERLIGWSDTIKIRPPASLNSGFLSRPTEILDEWTLYGAISHVSSKQRKNSECLSRTSVKTSFSRLSED